MAFKYANLCVRIEPEVKEQAEGILDMLGISVSDAINMFYKQIILQRGLPFDVMIPSNRPVNISTLSNKDMDAELEIGYEDMNADRIKPAKQVFANIYKGDQFK